MLTNTWQSLFRTV